MDDTSYAPVQDKGALLESGGFGGTTLGSNNSPNSNNMNSFSTSSNFDTSSYSPSSLPSHGFYNNSHSLWNKVTDIFEKPAAKLAAGITGLILLIVIIANAGGSGNNGKGDDYHNSEARGVMMGMDCSDKDDMLWGQPAHEHNGHYYQVVGGAYSPSPARITWREAMSDAGHRCHNENTGYLVAIQSQVSERSERALRKTRI